jgi:hypothetical protein
MIPFLLSPGRLSARHRRDPPQCARAPRASRKRGLIEEKRGDWGEYSDDPVPLKPWPAVCATQARPAAVRACTPSGLAGAGGIVGAGRPGVFLNGLNVHGAAGDLVHSAVLPPEVSLLGAAKTLRARWVMSRARWVMLRGRWVLPRR